MKNISKTIMNIVKRIFTKRTVMTIIKMTKIGTRDLNILYISGISNWGLFPFLIFYGHWRAQELVSKATVWIIDTSA